MGQKYRQMWPKIGAHVVKMVLKYPGDSSFLSSQVRETRDAENFHVC